MSAASSRSCGSGTTLTRVVAFVGSALQTAEVILFEHAAMPPKRIAMLVYPDAQCLDVSGPMEVFGLANRQLVEDRRCREAPYRLVLLSERAGPVRMSSGLLLREVFPRAVIVARL